MPFPLRSLAKALQGAVYSVRAEVIWSSWVKEMMQLLIPDEEIGFQHSCRDSVIRKSNCRRVPHCTWSMYSTSRVPFSFWGWFVGDWISFAYVSFQGFLFVCQLVSAFWLESRCKAFWNGPFTGSTTIHRYQVSVKNAMACERERERERLVRITDKFHPMVCFAQTWNWNK